MFDLKELLLRLAPLTAKLNPSSSSGSNIIQDLKALVGMVTQSTFHKFATLPDPVPFKSRLRAPIYFLPVHETADYESSIVGFRCAGDKIPLHNHPNMFGFVKAIRGKILVSSFSWMHPNDEDVLVNEKRNDFKCVGRRPVKCEGSLLLSVSDQPDEAVAVLGPLQGNIHSVQAVEDGAAFFDLLVPGYKESLCHYYADEVQNPVKGATYWLKRIPEPRDFITQNLQSNHNVGEYFSRS